jgi:protein-S-isoprenylcysteine O-methyltransferase Ste14
MWCASAVTPLLSVPVFPRALATAALAAVGIGLIVRARVMFAHAHTTWSPTTPGRTSHLVTSGVYRYTRNPMYVGMLLILLGWAVLLASPAALIVSGLFVVYLDLFQIRPEERALAAMRGKEYSDYVRRVRRWL